MKLFSYTTLVAASALATAAQAQQQNARCGDRIDEVRSQLEQRSLSSELQERIQQLLTSASNSDNCESMVMSAQELLQSSDATLAETNYEDVPTFEQADDDGNGSLDQLEVSTIEQIDFSQADADGNGSLSMQEYRQARDGASSTSPSRVEQTTVDSGASSAGAAESTASSAVAGENGGSGDQSTEVRVDQAAAQVDVDAASPQVQVRQRAPQVTVEQRAPEVTITQPEPEVTVDQSEPEVSVDQAEPEVQVSQAEPEVEVQPAAEPDVQVARTAGAPDTQSASSRDQEQADLVVRASDDPDDQTTRSATISEDEALDLIDTRVELRQGDQVGTVTEIVMADDEYFAVTELHGERKALPFENLEFDPQRNLVLLMSREELDRIPRYDEQRFTRVEARPVDADGNDQNRVDVATRESSESDEVER